MEIDNNILQKLLGKEITRPEDDFYPTPDWVTKELLRVEGFTGGIWEPACGDGSISRTLKSFGYKVLSTDITDHGYAEYTMDFLQATNDQVSVNIVTNPPYRLADEFVLQGLQLCKDKLALLLRLAYLEGSKRYTTIYAKYPPSRVHVFSERITMYPKGHEDKKSGGTTAFAWFVWDKKCNGPKPLISWIKPGAKPKEYK